MNTPENRELTARAPGTKRHRPDTRWVPAAGVHPAFSDPHAPTLACQAEIMFETFNVKGLYIAVQVPWGEGGCGG